MKILQNMKKWQKLGRVLLGKFFLFIQPLLSNLKFLYFREVFKARQRSTPTKFVAMKKVLMTNEKEGVSKKKKKLQTIKK